MATRLATETHRTRERVPPAGGDEYTPELVELLLRRLPYLTDRRPSNPDAPRRSKSASPGGWLEDQMARRADIEYALAQLPQPTYRIVYLSYVGGFSLREVGKIVGVSHETVRRHRIDGVRQIAWWLGWRDPRIGWGDAARVSLC